MAKVNVYDITLWIFQHPEIAPAIENYQFLTEAVKIRSSDTENYYFDKAYGILEDIRRINNPSVSGGLFKKAVKMFKKAIKDQQDNMLLLSHLGLMLCYQRLGDLNSILLTQQEVSEAEYKGTFWERNKVNLIDLGAAAMAGLGMLTGCPPGPAVALAGQGARRQHDQNNTSIKEKGKVFTNLKNAILAVRFT